MKAITKKPSSNDTLTKKRIGVKHKPILRAKNVAFFPSNNLFLQREPICSCGGGCPRCSANQSRLLETTVEDERENKKELLMGKESPVQPPSTGQDRESLISGVLPDPQDVNIDNDGNLRIDRCGNFTWSVRFSLPQPAAASGYIIQELEDRIDEGNGTIDYFHFWEAWPVSQSQRIPSNRGSASYDDTFMWSGVTQGQGRITFTGRARFYEGGLPPDFIFNNPDINCTPAANLYCSPNPPPFWTTGTGSPHEADITYDCSGFPIIWTEPYVSVVF